MTRSISARTIGQRIVNVGLLIPATDGAISGPGEEEAALRHFDLAVATGDGVARAIGRLRSLGIRLVPREN